MDVQHSQNPIPRRATRGIIKSSGLFDADFTDASDEYLKTIDTFDLLSAIDQGDDLCLNRTDDVLGSLVNDLDSDNMFNEKFMDLSNFLFNENEIAQMDSTEAGKASQKRKASESDEIASFPNPDHSYSTIKRPRLDSYQDGSASDDTMSDVTDKGKRYVERRKKNNIASKRSRETRKQKYVDMEQRAEELEKENRELEEKMKEMELLTKKMKDILVKRLAGASK